MSDIKRREFITLLGSAAASRSSCVFEPETIAWPLADGHPIRPRAARSRFQCQSANASGDVSSATHQSLRLWSSAYDSASAVLRNKPTVWKPSAGLPHIKIVVGIRALDLGCFNSSPQHAIAKGYVPGPFAQLLLRLM